MLLQLAFKVIETAFRVGVQVVVVVVVVVRVGDNIPVAKPSRVYYPAGIA